MKISKRLGQMLEDSVRSPTSLAERVKVLFAVSLEGSRRAAGLSYSDIASRIGSSPAYITKVFRGDSNLTIETMAKLAVATGSELDVRLVKITREPTIWAFDRNQRAASQVTATSVATITDNVAANHELFALSA